MTDLYDKYLDDFGSRLRSASAAPAPTPGRWRRGLIAGSVAAVGALALTLVLLLTGSPRGTPLDAVAQARAALSPRGEIVYLKIRTGGSAVIGPVSEQWTAIDPPRWRVVQRIPRTRRAGVVGDGRGRRITGRKEFSYAEGAQSTYLATLDELTIRAGYSRGGAAARVPSPLGGDPATDLRALLADGGFEDAGLVRAGARTLRRLIQRKALPGGQRRTFTYDVDPKTFAPRRGELRFDGPARPLSGGRFVPPLRIRTVFTILAYNRIPLNAQSAKLLRIQTTSKTKITRISAAERRRQLREAQKGCRTRANGTKVCPVPPSPRP